MTDKSNYACESSMWCNQVGISRNEKAKLLKIHLLTFGLNIHWQYILKHIILYF